MIDVCFTLRNRHAYQAYLLSPVETADGIIVPVSFRAATHLDADAVELVNTTDL